jgi:hypothetical protein
LRDREVTGDLTNTAVRRSNIRPQSWKPQRGLAVAAKLESSLGNNG